MAQHAVINPFVFFGCGGVGKTNLINRLCGLNFENRYIATVGLNITPIMNDGDLFADFVDTAGQELYTSFSTEMTDILKKTKIAVFVIDNTSKLNSMKIITYMKRFKELNPTFNGKVLLVQTKSDIKQYSKSFLFDVERMILMATFGTDFMYAVDSKTGTGITELENDIWNMM